MQKVIVTKIKISSFRLAVRSARAGVTLILMLCLIVLLTIVMLTLLSLSESNGLISSASAKLGKTDIYGHGAIDQVLGDLRQEITAGSTATSVYTNSTTGVVSSIYRPNIVAAAAPALSGPSGYGSPSNPTSAWNTEFPNLIKQSVYNELFYNATIGANSPNRAAPISTSADPTRFSQSSLTSGTSINGRSINISRWNKHLLLPKQSVTITGGNGSPTVISDTGSTDPTPTTQFLAPDWILTAADGSNPTTFNAATMANPQQSGYVVGRYAFAIYNEGGLLDANAAGSPTAWGPAYPPSSLSSSNPGTGRASQQILWSRKGGEAFADLTVLPGIANVSSVTPQQVANALVGWRNAATTQANAFPASTFGTIDSYFSNLLGISNRFMTVANASGLSDNGFTSRQQLISFLQDIVPSTDTADQAYLQDAMMYLTQFSRTLNQPSYWPDPNRPKIAAAASYGIIGNYAFGQDNIYNPAFKSIRVQTSFTRSDGNLAVVGEPLVKKRFPLSRLVWITYKGPSANNMADAAVQQSIAALGGNPTNTSDPVYQFVAQGTAANISADFGLVWTAGPGTGGIGGYWAYGTVHKAPARSVPNAVPLEIARLQDVAAANRDPDFFELLQAAICCGSLGTVNPNASSASTSGNSGVWQQQKDAQVSLQVLQIGANMINQVSPVNFPVQIVFNNTSSAWPAAQSYTYSIWGSTDLPYLSNLGNIAFVVHAATTAPEIPPPPSTSDTVTAPGWGVVLAVPTVWDPYASSATPSNSAFSPTALRISIMDVCLDQPNTPGSTFSQTYQTLDWNFQPMTLGVEPWIYDGNNGLVNAQGMAVSPINNTRNNMIYFNNAPTLYREPFPLMEISGNPAGNPATLSIDIWNMIKLEAVADGISGDDWSSGIPELGTGNKYIGFFLAGYPLRIQSGTAPATTTATVSSLLPNNGVGRTISLEYQSGSAWIPYQQYDFPATFSQISVPYTSGGSQFFDEPIMQSWPAQASPVVYPWKTNILCDPRTGRFAPYKDEAFQPFLASTFEGALQTVRPGAGIGTTDFADNAGAQTQNLTTVPNWNGNPSYLKDPDGVVRRAMGGYTPSGSTIGLPMVTQNYPSRAIILHRPFRSVTEMGYVFSDTPWKNIDFFSSESGDNALLDTFCINDDNRTDAVAAGQVDLNGRQAPVFQALLAGAYRDEWNSVTPSPSTGVGSPGLAPDLTNSEAAKLAQALVSRTTSTNLGSGPLGNIADLVGRYTAGFSNPNMQPYDGFSSDVGAFYNTSLADGPVFPIVQRFRETAIRTLADAGQAGTWNLLIDVIAQSGRYPSQATSFSDFVIDGERHYWVHVAIDRTTGEIIDKNIEIVNE